MCPACIASAAVIAGGGASLGGLAAFIVKLRSKLTAINNPIRVKSKE
ncbi:MAG: hypothetical protein ACRD5M_16840 [Candidatus Acidiferrales bacterium]